MNQSLEYLLKYINLVINGQKVNLVEEDANWDEIFELARKHRVDVILYFALKDNKQKIISNSYKENLNKLEAVVASCELLEILKNANIETVLQNMEKNGIPCMPLKGWILKDMYPEPIMRTMSDIDILIDKSYVDLIPEIMRMSGFELQLYGDKADIYLKQPGVYIEMHKSLVSGSQKFYAQYYKDIWKRLKLQEGHKSVYIMSDEDFYIFHIVHMAKHFKGAGIGIRAFVDIYIFCEAKWNKLNHNYLTCELNKLDLIKFESIVRNISYHWFGDENYSKNIHGCMDMTRDDIIRLSHMLLTKMQSSSVYGNRKESEINAVAKTNKIVWLINKIFPPVNKMWGKYTVLKKYQFLMPVYWIKRWIDLLLFERKKVFVKLKALKADKGKIAMRNNFIDDMGLKEEND